ncbi:acyltransferase family protein [Porphyromonas sp.]|jgi:membrane protein|uniref:acyltransferase family protein n=1 Tax=Porphyromonas sp. TaxID=1924944 RepID=UPI00258116E6|nr:acyltransferase family protein [Porphyromonas sp.]
MSSLSTERQPATARASVSSLYVLKALLAFFVVTCHAPILLPWVNIPGLATELFFAITGYFLYSEDLGKIQSRIWKSIKKVIPIMIFLQLLYIPLAPPDWKSPVVLFNWAFMGIANFDAVHLWYLTSLLYSLITFSLFIRFTKGKYIPVLFLCVLGWMILGDYRYFIDGKDGSIYLFNFISRALPFLAMGYWIRANESVLLQRKWLNIYIVLWVLSCSENLLIHTLSQGQADGGFVEIFPLRFAFFMLIISYKELGQGTWLETIGEKYSGNIYYYHMAVIIGWKALNPHSPLLNQIYDYAGAFVVFFISLLIAILIERCSLLFKRFLSRS